jgi:hypothetical protein
MHLTADNRSRFRRVFILAGAAVAVGAGVLPALAAGESLVNVASPTTPFSQNKQNEPALAVDANHPNILVGGSNDEIDEEGCNAGDPTTCPFTAGIGVSGVYFSFDSGKNWTQPQYSGYTARTCLGPSSCAPSTPPTPAGPDNAGIGPIGTLPGYVENGLVSDGDPALAFGPVPGANGFKWSNGSRLYYANLTSNFPGTSTFKGFEAIAVSRTDDITAAAGGGATGQAAWMNPVIVSKQSSTTFSDKEQIWADNASSSPFFGNVYICNAAFRSQEKGHAVPAPLMVATSTDGGGTWRHQQVSPSVNNSNFPGRSGCTIRTDSHGVVYVFAEMFGAGGHSAHILIQSFDGGKTFTTQRPLFAVTDPCVFFDPVLGRCVEDGVAGARNDLAASPSVDIANGAPTGVSATNEIVDSWADLGGGKNNERVMLSYSRNGGNTWSTAVSIGTAGDRGYYAAPAISPNGANVYVTYNAFTTPFQDTTATARNLVGVTLHATVTHGVPGAFSELDRSPGGDPRASSQNNLVGEFLGDYVYAVATNTYGAGVWNDTRNGADCPAIDAWRQSLRTAPGTVARPAPDRDCPGGAASTFGNSDIFSFTSAP